ncbi:MAG TPA: hypothetical protein VG317_07190 [Pseudonocardiaceae bacterium]|nr:hypothetical protein [Pseudonocardiaceae bacterium]
MIARLIVGALTVVPVAGCIAGRHCRAVRAVRYVQAASSEQERHERIRVLVARLSRWRWLWW